MANEKSEKKPEKKPQRTMMAIHPIAKKFPRLPAREIKELREDVRSRMEHGLPPFELPLLVSKDGKMLYDGVTRWGIAHELDIPEKDIPMERYNGKEEDIPNVILSRNVFRRHLTDDQRTAIVTEILAPILEQQAAERKKAGVFAGNGDTTKGSVADHIAEQAKTTPYKAEQALRSRKKGTLGAVRKGTKTLKEAAGERKTRKPKAPPTLEDEVWTRFERFIKYWPQHKHREVKAILRKRLAK